MLNDEIVDEVRAVREAHAAKFNFDQRSGRRQGLNHIFSSSCRINAASFLSAVRTIQLCRRARIT